MKKKSGISLIVLIITIIVIIILAAVVILTITKNNPVESAKEATFKEDVKAFQDDLALTVAKEYTNKQGQRDTKINATGEGVKNYIPSFKDKYVNKFAIVDDKLVATDKITEKEKIWVEELNVNSDETEETNYTSEEIESSEYLYAIGKTKPEYVVAKFNNDYTEVVITKNGEESDGIIQDFAPWTNFSPMSDRKDTLQKAIVKNGIIDLGYGSAGGGTFSNCTNLKSIILPNGLMYIKQACFDGCKSLTNISLPDSVISIDNAFGHCNSLVNIVIPESVTSIGYSAFSSCSGLINITIPNSVTSIGQYAFSNCSSLANITIPESITSIGNGAFYNCSSLTSVTIPESVTSIGQNAFYNCSSLINITYNGTKEQWNNIDERMLNGKVDWCDSTLKTITCTDGVITL